MAVEYCIHQYPMNSNCPWCERDALAAQVARLCADAAESDQEIRELAKRVLPASQVDGNSVCVPPLVEVVAAVVGRVAELRKPRGWSHSSFPLNVTD